MSPARKKSRIQPVSLKLSPDLEELLDRLAREKSLSRSGVLREALRAYAGGTSTSAAAIAGDLAGSLEGPRDLSTSARHMSGFGE